MQKIQFQKGMHTLNPQPNFNYQLNRVVMWNGGRLADIVPVARRIVDSASWKQELIALGDQAMRDGRTENAIGYYRMSEFFMYDGDPDKLKYYRLASKLFYDHYDDYFANGTVEKLAVPYEGISLPVLHAKPEHPPKDVILLHGGNDSYYEELFFPMVYFVEHGFEVYLFEGPGQGGVVREQGKHFTHQWEKPVGAVLDALGLTDVTIIGASLGGMLAPRAAAFDKRIARVIGWSIFPNFLEAAIYYLPKTLRKAVRFCVQHNCKGIVNRIIGKQMKNDPTADWVIRHGMYAYEADSPFAYMKKLNDYQMVDVADQITQDFLLLGAAEDHFIATGLYQMEIDALTNVRSLTYRLFTRQEEASNHCNLGNSALCLDTIMTWITQIKAR